MKRELQGRYVIISTVGEKTQAVETAQQLLDLSNQDRDKISGLGRAAASTLQVQQMIAV